MPRKNIALRFNFVKSHLVLICMASLLAATVQSRQLTLDEATDVALNNTSRGSIIVGKREVAEQTYNARRINFLVPEISINGRLPSYSVDESFRLFIGGDGKQLYKTRDISFNTFVELKQSLCWLAKRLPPSISGQKLRATFIKAPTTWLLLTLVRPNASITMV